MAKKKTVAFSKNATNIFFHILTGCNLKCRHCYINPDQHGKDMVKIETIEKWLTAFPGKYRTTNVIFLGGEPTLHPDLSRAVKSARRLGFQSVTVDTNGYLFHDFLSKVTPADLDYLSFSLDGAVPEINDALRGEGSYDTCLSGLRRAKSLGFSTSMIYTVSRANLDGLVAMVPLLADLKPDRFFIQVIGIRGKSVESMGENLQVSPDEWLRVIPEVAKKIADLGITVSYPKVFLGKSEKFECAGNVAHNYFIFPNGRVYQCPLCEDFPLHSYRFKEDQLVSTPRLNEADLFHLTIAEGCVINKLFQPGNIVYDEGGKPVYPIACCLLKEELS